jgi:hypothetical protein
MKKKVRRRLGEKGTRRGGEEEGEKKFVKM